MAFLKSGSKGGNNKRLLIAGIAIFIALISIGTLGIGFFSSSETCVICHVERAQYDSWQKSSHREIPCLACHAPTGGALTFVADRISVSFRYTFKQIFGYKKPINADSKLSQEGIPKERCLRCHDLGTRKVTPSPQLVGMTSEAHFKMLALGLQCPTCHNRVAHKEKDSSEIQYDKGELGENFKYKNFMGMKEGCLRCHSSHDTYVSAKGVTAPTACTTCHPKDWPVLPIGHQEGWRYKHGPIAREKNFIYCLGCHSKNGPFNYQGNQPWCNKCHDKTAVEGFIKQAGMTP